MRELGHGPVELDVDAPTFCGAIALSNNTAELSALPHILVQVLIWRRQAMADAARAAGTFDESATEVANSLEHLPLETLILAHDSQYVKDTCECAPGAAPAATNTCIGCSRRR